MSNSKQRPTQLDRSNARTERNERNVDSPPPSTPVAKKRPPAPDLKRHGNLPLGVQRGRKPEPSTDT
jgi:hypothetical protein